MAKQPRKGSAPHRRLPRAAFAPALKPLGKCMEGTLGALTGSPSDIAAESLPRLPLDKSVHAWYYDMIHMCVLLQCREENMISNHANVISFTMNSSDSFLFISVQAKLAKVPNPFDISPLYIICLSHVTSTSFHFFLFVRLMSIEKIDSDLPKTACDSATAPDSKLDRWHWRARNRYGWYPTNTGRSCRRRGCCCRLQSR